ncbi:MAG: hypothetical protein IPK26_30125 [Planctomycetes bacterium]|nr:hypothetical protein [Planctomycetota bacterium]
MMHSFPLLPLLLLPTLWSPAEPPALPSDPAGVYALLDRVALLPDANNPDRVEIEGAFCLAVGHGGDYYRSPVRGRLTFTASDKKDQSIAEWRDLAKVAGTGRIVAFGSRYEQHEHPPRVIVAGQAATEPAPYPLGWGIREVGTLDYGPVRELRLLPTPLSPLDANGPKASANRRPGRDVTFECKNCLADQKDLRYVFEVQVGDGERFASPPVEPGQGTTKWTTEMALQAGEKIVWRVHVLHLKAERTPVAEAMFVVGQAEAARK